MKKSKLLMLSAITPVSLVLPLVATSCNKGEAGEFVCEQTEQKTVRGDTACWYTFDYSGSNIPSDLEVKFNEETPIGKLSSIILVQPIADTNKVKVGIQGISKNLEDNESVAFGFKFISKEHKLKQSIPCTYTFLESKIETITPKNNEVDVATGTQIDVQLNFNLSDKSFDEKDMVVIICGPEKSSDAISIPEKPRIIRKETDSTLTIIFEITKTETFVENDWAKFDLTFKNKTASWEQTIKGYTYGVKEVQYKAVDELDTETQVQIDYKGTMQSALKATDDNEEGILKTGTPIGTSFKLTYSKNNALWKDENYLKFGSYVNPPQTFVGYHIFWSISVSIKKSNDDIETLNQTKPGDYSGDEGYWWISEGGPITVISKKINEIYGENWKELIFTLRTADEIKNDTSFYITYA